MSTIETVLTRMMSDVEFANEVLADADSALAPYALPEDDLKNFRALTETDIQAITAEDRTSFGKHITAVSPISCYFPPVG